MNQCQLLGRLVRDPELRYTPQGTPVCSFTLAVGRRYNREKTDFIRVITWRNTAEFCANYFQKGSRIALVGSIQTRTWEDDNGRKHSTVEVVADSVYFAESKRDNQPESPVEYAIASGDFIPVDMDEDCPSNGPAGEGRESTWMQKKESAKILKTYFKTMTRK